MLNIAIAETDVHLGPRLYGSGRARERSYSSLNLEVQAVEDGLFVDVIFSRIAKTRNALLLGKRP